MGNATETHPPRPPPLRKHWSCRVFLQQIAAIKACKSAQFVATKTDHKSLFLLPYHCITISLITTMISVQKNHRAHLHLLLGPAYESTALLVIPTAKSSHAHNTLTATLQSAVPSDLVMKPKHSQRVVRTTYPSVQSKNQPTHQIDLDAKRVAYSYCDLHTIPEGEPCCVYRGVVDLRECVKRRRRNRAMGADKFNHVLEQVIFQEVIAAVSDSTVSLSRYL